MAVDWQAKERAQVEAALARHPVTSGRCAAVARVVYEVGAARDPATRGRHLRPKGAERYVVPKHDPNPRWGNHTFSETHGHAVDALTGSGGCLAGDYLAAHWEEVDYLLVHDIDPFTVDPGIEDDT